MPTSAQSHARSHALLLLQKLLNLRDGASPLTLVLDTLEQSGRPVLREFMVRAKACPCPIAKSKIIFVSFATVKKPRDADIFVKARGKALAALQAEIASHYPPGGAQTFLSSLITHPSISLLGSYNADVPLVLGSENEYAPHPLATLNHLATAILRVSSLRHEADRRRARDRSLPEPGWGLGEGREGVLVGLGRQRQRQRQRKGGSGREGGGYDEEDGLVVEMELRRRSGRAVTETFVLVPSPSTHPRPTTTTTTAVQSASAPAPALTSPARVSLLSDHPLFRKGGEEDEGDGEGGAVNGGGDAENGMETTFSLGLTEKQRRDREGVVLPYFDAQMDIGGGEGGRILYEMGREDDFDDEEDEI
ncbi:hypothetical protein SLS62_007451 [Diatrype stigma]|uniref:Elongator complex protein 5 n=1 Tax=Diatrype stigma TaxID=117547 RepID=A0AAN9YQQ3_9PEZI